MSSPRAASRTLAACLLALAIWLGLNGLAAWRLPAVLAETLAADLDVIEGRVADYPDPQAVRVLVFGNSNAQAGLRPPMLAEALEMPENGVFSLALPMSTVHEQALLFERYRQAFPGATLAIVAVDEFLFSAVPELRLRRLTAYRPLERWRFAQRERDMDRRLGLMAGCFLPLVDFHQVLKDRSAIARAIRGPGPESRRARLERVDYRWGYPPTWETMAPEALAAFVERQQHARQIIRRTTNLLGGAKDTESQLAELSAFLTALERSGLRVQLVTTPYEARAGLVQARQLARPYAAYARALAAFSEREGRSILTAPRDWPASRFYDANHLNVEGARALAAHLAPALAARLAAAR